MFSLKLFGGVVLYGSQGPLTGRLTQRRRLALLAVLAAAGPKPVSRDRLLALFWPETDDDRARHSLADSVYLIRKELGERAISSIGEDLLLDHQLIRSDVRAFEEALARQDLDAAVTAYDGPFLDGFHLDDAPDFERWVDAERDRLARAFADALEQLAENATARGQTKPAVDWWRRLLALDPYSSRVTLRLMSACEAAGDRAAAIQHARTHATLLETEFGAGPDPDVSAFAERLRTGAHPAGTSVPTPVAPFTTPAAATSPELRDAPPQAPAAAAPPPSTAAATAPGRPRSRTGVLAVAVIATASVLLFIAQLPRDAAEGTVDAAGRIDSRTIAVLPCANLSGDPADEPFSDGLTEELSAVLAQVQALRVVARTSAFAFKNQNRDIREIGRALDVGTVVECSVRRAGGRFRVTAQLINTADGFHLWADTYERDGSDLLEIQSDLAVQIADALQARLNPAEQERLARRATTNPDAHAMYLKGRYFWNQRTSGSFAQAITYFQRAIELDSSYARAYAGLARAYALNGMFSIIAPAQARARMHDAARRAVALDAELPEAYAELGAYFNVYEWNAAESERAFQRAIQLDPNYSVAHHLYGNLLAAMGRTEEAIAQKRLALQLEPLVPQYTIAVGQDLLEASKTDEALRTFREAVELDSLYWIAHDALGDYFEANHQFAAAVSAHRRAVQLANNMVRARAGLARALARNGEAREARQLLASLQAHSQRTGSQAPDVAAVLAALGDTDAAIAWLEQSVRQKHPYLRVMRPIAELADDPRYLDLQRRIGRHPSTASRPD